MDPLISKIQPNINGKIQTPISFAPDTSQQPFPSAPYPSSISGSVNSSTPQQTSSNSFSDFFGGLGKALNSAQGGFQPDTPQIAPTKTGGISFNPSLVGGFSNSEQSTPTQTTVQKPESQSLADFVLNKSSTSGGGTLGMTGNGTPSSYNPNANFFIDTSGTVPSSALGSTATPNDLTQQHSQYQDYVTALAHAQGYSPEYIQALQAQQKAQTEGSALQLNSSALNSNLYTGNNLPGDTMNYAQGATAKAQAQNTLALSQNAIQQLSAGQQMQVQALIRSGNIASAQALVQASQPTTVSPGASLVSPLTGQEQYSGLGGYTGVQAIQTYNNLQQRYPDANIPAYNSSISPEQNLQIAQESASEAPSFQSQTPEGVANISSLKDQQGYLDTTTRSYQTATSNLGTLQTFMQQNGINDSAVPIINQIQNKVKANLLAPGVISAFKSSVAGLRAEYAQVLSRGGTVTDTARGEADTLIPDDLNPSQLQTVTKQLSQEGQNAIKESQNEVNTIKTRLSGTSANNGTSVGWY